MNIIVPDYYKKFHCKADKCLHSCCVGWEIDIDEDTLSIYESLDNDFGRKICDSIDYEAEPHFKLQNGERCPFLNSNGLCDIICELGDGAISDICADHPRFRNFFSDHIEMGLGLCCEAAADLILSQKSPPKYIDLDSGEEFALTLPCLPEISFENCDFYPLLFSLERLDKGWENYLELLKFTQKDNLTEYETVFDRLREYFLFRYKDTENGDLFSAFSVYIIRKISAGFKTKNGYIDIKTVADICRMYSGEVEYSDENVEKLMSIIKDGSF